MKKVFLTSLTAALSLVLSAGAFAQSQDFIYTPTQHMVDTIAADNYDMFQIDITTPTPEAITFKWERVSNSFHQDWSYALCDLGGCYVGIPASGTMGSISLAEAQNGQQAFLKLSMTVGQNFHHGVAKFYVYDAADYSRGDTVSFDLLWQQSAVGVEEQAKTPFTFAPNPVNDQMNIQVADQNVTLSVHDVTGKLVHTQTFTAHTNGTLNFTAYKPGIYFLRGQTASGKVITERIVKQ